MKGFGFLLIGMIAGVVLVLASLWLQPAASAQAETGQLAGARLQAAASATPSPASDEGRSGAAVAGASAPGGDELPPANLGTSLEPSALATPVPGETLAYFVPTDNNATATVLYLYNTDTVAHTVALRGYSYNGVLVYSLNIEIDANSFKRLVSDSVAAGPPPSWATPAPLVTNCTDFTYLASLSLPSGVKVEGYTLYNPGTGVVDPRVDQGAVPLQFINGSPSAAFSGMGSVYLPAVKSGN
jgi:hypothetical protein